VLLICGFITYGFDQALSKINKKMEISEQNKSIKIQYGAQTNVVQKGKSYGNPPQKPKGAHNENILHLLKGSIVLTEVGAMLWEK
jgi:hypothetical protein